MTIQEFRDYMASGKPVVGGGEVHRMFHKLSQEALKITAEITVSTIPLRNCTTCLNNFGDEKYPRPLACSRRSIQTVARTPW